MTFKDYLLTLSGSRCTLWIDGMSYSTPEGRLCYTGVMEVYDDFVLSYPDSGGTPTAFLIRDIKCIEAEEIEEDEEEEEPSDVDANVALFEAYYRKKKGQS